MFYEFRRYVGTLFDDDRGSQVVVLGRSVRRENGSVYGVVKTLGS